MKQRVRAAAEESGAEIDAALVSLAATGDVDAFEQLYRRHVQAAWRVAQAVAGNPDDATDAVADAFIRVFQSVRLGRLDDAAHFRPYLLSASRNAAVDVLRRTGRIRPTDTLDNLDSPSEWGVPSEAMLDGVDSSLVAAAFRSLPERWRSVLWLTEVEGITPKEAAPLLGVSPNGVAQLAVRARAGLRERFLQAHLRRSDVEHDCRHTVDRLGAYVAGGLAPREIAKVDQHLAGCEACRCRLVELEDLGSTLRRVAVPLPVALAALGAKLRMAATGAEAAHAAAATAGASVLPGAGAGSAALVVQKPLAMAAAALFAAGAVGIGVIGLRPGSSPSQPGAPSAGSVTAAAGGGSGAGTVAAAAAEPPVETAAASPPERACTAPDQAPPPPTDAVAGQAQAVAGSLAPPGSPADPAALLPGPAPVPPAPVPPGAVQAPVAPPDPSVVVPSPLPPAPAQIAAAPGVVVAPPTAPSVVVPGAGCGAAPVPAATPSCLLAEAATAANSAGVRLSTEGTGLRAEDLRPEQLAASAPPLPGADPAVGAPPCTTAR